MSDSARLELPGQREIEAIRSASDRLRAVASDHLRRTRTAAITAAVQQQAALGNALTLTVSPSQCIGWCGVAATGLLLGALPGQPWEVVAGGSATAVAVVILATVASKARVPTSYWNVVLTTALLSLMLVAAWATLQVADTTLHLSSAAALSLGGILLLAVSLLDEIPVGSRLTVRVCAGIAALLGLTIFRLG